MRGIKADRQSSEMYLKVIIKFIMAITTRLTELRNQDVYSLSLVSVHCSGMLGVINSEIGGNN